MSLRAMLWALHEAPVEDAQELAVLIAMADPAYDDGTNSAESTANIAYKARCSSRTAQRRIDALEVRGLVRKGDQAAVAHIRADRRPVVYDLNLAARRDDHRELRAPSRPATGRQAVTPYGVTAGHGVTGTAARGDTAVSPNPTTNPTTSTAGVDTGLYVVGPVENPPQNDLAPTAPADAGPWCAFHPGGTVAPCKACARAADDWTTAQARAAHDREREAARAFFRADRKAKGQAVPAEAVADTLTATREAIRQNRAKAALPKVPEMPDVPRYNENYYEAQRVEREKARQQAEDALAGAAPP